MARFHQKDPIEIFGGENSFSHTSGNPIFAFDPFGLEKWQWNAQGNVSYCKYYDAMAILKPKYYYKIAGNICRVKHGIVNIAVNAAIPLAWAGDSNDSQSTILENIRTSLIIVDDKAQKEKRTDPSNGCVLGTDIDAYHNTPFTRAGLTPIPYGGNMWPQGIWPNPVPSDPRNNTIKRLLDFE